MPVPEIIATIDAYIARLRAARELLASNSHSLEFTASKPSKPKNRRSIVRGEMAESSSAATEVPIQVIPPRMPRQRRGQVRSVSTTTSPLGGKVPQGPVVIHSSEVARMRTQSSREARSTDKAEQFPGSRNLLTELTEEVVRRRNGQRVLSFREGGR